MAVGDIHVVPAARDAWTVEIEGAGRSSLRYESEEEAIKDATMTAKVARVELIIHGRDGQVRERKRFGHARADSRGQQPGL